jgi:hypothetical protein
LKRLFTVVANPQGFRWGFGYEKRETGKKSLVGISVEELFPGGFLAREDTETGFLSGNPVVRFYTRTGRDQAARLRASRGMTIGFSLP